MLVMFCALMWVLYTWMFSICENSQLFIKDVHFYPYISHLNKCSFKEILHPKKSFVLQNFKFNMTITLYLSFQSESIVIEDHRDYEV